MADLAVGLVSLALQVSKGLAWYIDGAKGAKDRVSRIAQEVERLADCLEQLDLAVKRTEQSIYQDTATAGIVACADALTAIEEKLGANKNVGASEIRQRIRSFGQRLAFPFKQDEIAFLRDVLSSMEQQLQLALSSLQLDAQQRTNRLIVETAQLSQAHVQYVSKKQDDLLENSKLQFAQQAELTRTVSTSGERLSLTQAGVMEMSQQMYPMAADLSKLSSTFPELLSKLSRLEEKVDEITPQRISPRAIQDEVRDLATISGGIREIRRKASKKRIMERRCTCRGHTDTTVYLQWPVQLTKFSDAVHDAECEYSAIEEAVTRLQIRFTMCSISLQRKAHIGLALSKGAGSASISPSLSCDRVVTKSSPAFRLLANFKKRLEPDPGVEAWQKPAKELLRLFQLRKASPYDRLSNGLTLLHYLCCTMQKFHIDGDPEMLIENYYGIGKHLLEYLPTQAMEKDDEGRTCVDYFLMSSHTDLLNHFLEHGISFSAWPIGPNSLDWEWVNELLGLNPSVMDVFDCSEQRKVMHSHSEQGLVDLILAGKIPPDYLDGGYSLYDIATSVGWRRGCEILFEYGIKVRSWLDFKPTLLGYAIEREQKEIASFWLGRRKELDITALQHVGSIEEAIFSHISWKSTSKEAWVSLCLPALIRERQQLQSLAAEHLIETANDRLLDAKAWNTIERLGSRGTKIQPFLKPPLKSIYRIPSSRFEVRLWDMLYEAGFRDVTSGDFADDTHPTISPLLYLLTRLNVSISPRDLTDLVNWFVSKGASLYEQWPDSQLCVAHCLGYQLGRSVYYIPENYHQWQIEEFPSCFSNRAADDCQCACSTSGCLFVTSFFKGLTTPIDNKFKVDPEEIEDELQYIRRSWRDRLHVTGAYVGEATVRRQNRWLVTEAIRLAVFNQLEIRHTCCDPSRIFHYGEENYDDQPGPRYDEEDMQRIREEDAYLVELLETLVKELDEKFDTSSDDLATFFEFTLVEKMDCVLSELENADRSMYAQARREFGVVMGEVEDDDEEEEEEESMESDDQSNVESFDDAELEL